MLPNAALQQAVEQSELERAFRLAGRATIALNRTRHVISISPPAEHLIGGELRVFGRRLALLDPVLNARLSSLIEACLSHDPESGLALPPPITVLSGDGSAITIDGWPVPRSNWKDQFEPAVILLVRSADLAPGRVEQLLHRLYRLTPCEARLAVALAGDTRLADLAASRGISVSTARAHLKSIFSKTGTHRQAELVSLIGKLSR